MMWNKVVSSLALMRLLSVLQLLRTTTSFITDLKVDCHHPDYGSKGSRSTNGKIKAELHSECPGYSSNVGYEESDGFDYCGDWFTKGATFGTLSAPYEAGYRSTQKWLNNCFQSLKLYIDPDSDGANDAFFIDQLKLFFPHTKNLKWGRNKGRGWCLSNQATDKFTGPNGDINCHPCILFEPDGEWSYCQIEE
jgi:hypothetical protein